MLTCVTVELKAKAIGRRQKWLGESDLYVEPSDSISAIGKKVVEVAAEAFRRRCYRHGELSSCEIFQFEIGDRKRFGFCLRFVSYVSI